MYNTLDRKKRVIEEFRYKFIVKRPRKATRYDLWVKNYEEDLLYMFMILGNGLNEGFSNKINLEFGKFCEFIYNTSSKSI